MREQRTICFSPMRKSLIFCLGMLLTFVIAACNSGGANSSNSSVLSLDCHLVQHTQGKTCVPNDPQRIIILGGLDDALSLGIKPIASDSINQDQYYLKNRVDGIEDIGGSNAPNIERILALKPDLIVGSDHANVDYSTLSKIAPTVLLPFEHSGQWKEFFMHYADVFGKYAEAEHVMELYYRRLEEFKQRMGDRAAETEVSILRVYPTHINLYLKDSFCGTIVADAGLSRPPSQNLSAAEANTLFGNHIQYEISREKISDVDGDVIFIWTYGHQNKITQQAQAEKEKLTTDSLWFTLTAVQQERVYEVPGYWIGSGPIAANAILDDLFKYLLELPQS